MDQTRKRLLRKRGSNLLCSDEENSDIREVSKSGSSDLLSETPSNMIIDLLDDDSEFENEMNSSPKADSNKKNTSKRRAVTDALSSRGRIPSRGTGYLRFFSHNFIW